MCGGTSLRCHVGWSNQGGSGGSGYLDRRGSVSKGRLGRGWFSVVGDWVRNRIVYKGLVSVAEVCRGLRCRVLHTWYMDLLLLLYLDYNSVVLCM